LTAHRGTATVTFYFNLMLGGHVVSKPVISPRIRKTSSGATTSPQSQRCAVSTCVKFLSRGKR
jgi:hypothetical protein